MILGLRHQSHPGDPHGILFVVPTENSWNQKKQQNKACCHSVGKTKNKNGNRKNFTEVLVSNFMRIPVDGGEPW